jgi:ATP-binding cassette subfamily B (MDR/TAP) protein 1
MAGFAYGLGQLTQFVSFGLMFFFAGKIIKDNYDPVTKVYNVNPQDVFLAIFAMMMGASHAGMAASFGPDNSKAMAAAKRIFTIQSTPSAIDSIKIDE